MIIKIGKFVVQLILLCICTQSMAVTANITAKNGFVNVDGGKVWYKIYQSEATKTKIPLLVVHGGPGIPHNYLIDLKAIAVNRPVIFL